MIIKTVAPLFDTFPAISLQRFGSIKSSSMAPLSILIVGCGIAGPTLASFLLLTSEQAHEKPHITILERSSSLRAQGQNVDVRGAGVAIARKLGLETVIRASTTREEGAQFVDSQNRVWASFAADKSGKVQTGTSDIEILRGRLAEICFRRCKSISDEVKKDGGKGVDFIFGDYLEEIDQDGEKVNVRFAKSGERRTFDLVVGADGLQSRTRRKVFGDAGEEDRVTRFGMYGGFFSMPTSETDSLWRRWYRAPGRRAIMVRPSDQPDKTTVFMYVVNEHDARLREAVEQGNKGVEEQKSLLKEYFQDAGWECKRIVKQMEAANDFYYDMIGQVKMDRWAKGRVVLLGDAGYCGSPISGMGTTLALSGAYNLAGALVRHPNDYNAAFAQYEESMGPVVDKAQKVPSIKLTFMAPETSWGISLLLAFGAFLQWSGLALLIFKLLGPPADEVTVEEHGFRQLSELEG